MKLFWITT